MTRRRRRLCIGCLLVTILGPVAAQDERPTFRSTAAAVRVDVSVLDNDRPVSYLTAGDFELVDDGVRQKIADLSYGKLPIDVTVALDVSRSVTGDLLANLRRSVDDVRGRLRNGDRLKLMAFNQRVRRILDYSSRSADTKAAFDGLSGSGGTALLDALAVAMTSAAPVDRRQLVILFSDGVDTNSVADPAALIDLARHTTPTVVFVGPFDWSRGSQLPRSLASEITAPLGGNPPPRNQAPPLRSGRLGTSSLYERLADETGGLVVSLPGVGANLQGTFGRILDDFRSSYVLYFTPQSAAKPGFHTIDVRVTRSGSYEIRARRGYVRE
jgi:VWFA-related protein